MTTSGDVTPADQKTRKARRKKEALLARLDFSLRSQQVQYLEYLADRDSIPMSRALGMVVAAAMATNATPQQRRTVKISKHFTIESLHLQFLDILAVRLGLHRSDIVRRLIDDAIEKDPTL